MRIPHAHTTRRWHGRSTPTAGRRCCPPPHSSRGRRRRRPTSRFRCAPARMSALSLPSWHGSGRGSSHSGDGGWPPRRPAPGWDARRARAMVGGGRDAVDRVLAEADAQALQQQVAIGLAAFLEQVAARRRQRQHVRCAQDEGVRRSRRRVRPSVSRSRSCMRPASREGLAKPSFKTVLARRA